MSTVFLSLLRALGEGPVTEMLDARLDELAATETYSLSSSSSVAWEVCSSSVALGSTGQVCSR